jgi:long-chain acyl-CoA synthetase
LSVYGGSFWKRSWDEGLTDLDPSAFETTYVDMIKPVFEERPNKTALCYLGVDVTFGELDGYSNQFANMLFENGFRKGDIVGINLPSTPEYVIALIGTLKAGCVVSGVSPLMSAPQVQYQMSDLGGGERRLAFVTLDAASSDSRERTAPLMKSPG